MNKFDYSYYRDTFGGKASLEEFKRYSDAALDVVSLLIGKDAETLSDTAVLRALCTETDYLIRELERDASISRESIGDYSVSYGKCGGVDIASLPVSAEAIAALTRVGLMTRWV